MVFCFLTSSVIVPLKSMVTFFIAKLFFIKSKPRHTPSFCGCVHGKNNNDTILLSYQVLGPVLKSDVHTNTSPYGKKRANGTGSQHSNKGTHTLFTQCSRHSFYKLFENVQGHLCVYYLLVKFGYSCMSKRKTGLQVYSFHSSLYCTLTSMKEQ